MVPFIHNEHSDRVFTNFYPFTLAERIRNFYRDPLPPKIGNSTDVPVPATSQNANRGNAMRIPSGNHPAICLFASMSVSMD